MDYLNEVGPLSLNNGKCISWCLAILVLCITLFWKFRNPKQNLPPGPFCLPIVGYLPIARGGDVVVECEKLSRKFGKILSVYLGPVRLILLNDDKIVKEAFENPVLQDRPPGLFDFYPDGLGLATESGDEWKEQRRFAWKGLMDMVFEKTNWQEHLIAEINDFLKTLEDEGGKPYDVEPLVSVTITNIVLSICFGKRFPIGDPVRKLADDGVTAVTRTFSESPVVMIFPNVMKFLCRLGLTKFATEYRKMCAFSRIVKSEIEYRKHTMDNDNKEVFVDEYIKEMEQMRKKNTFTLLNDYNLCGMVKSVVIAGSDATKTSILWLLLAMAAFPGVQKKVQEEVDENLGKEGIFTSMDRYKLPYTYATILELLRWKAPGPFGVLHRSSQDTKIAGYDIPKNTNIAANISYIHYNENVWDDPTSFEPERFLTKHGKIFEIKADNYLPNSDGLRKCPGAKIGFTVLIFFIVNVLQNFKIIPSEDKSPDLSGLRTSQLQPIRQKLRFEVRY